LQFSDGYALTAEDVAFTFNSVIAPGSDSVIAKRTREKFVSVTAESPTTIRFILSGPLATLWSDLETGILKKAAASADGKFAGGMVVSAGPYKIVTLNSQHALLLRNDFYNGVGGKAMLPKLELRFVTAPTARVLMLAGGSADLVQNAIPPDVLADMQKDRIAIDSAPSLVLTYLMLNQADPKLADVRVRKAIAYALDRKSARQIRQPPPTGSALGLGASAPTC